MCRHYAELSAAMTASVALWLSGCSSTPGAADAMPPVPTDASPSESSTVGAPATTAPLKESSPGASSGVAAGNTAQKLSPANPQPAVPGAAARQFDEAVAMLNSGNASGAESAFRSLAAAYPTYAAPAVNLAIIQAKAGQLEAAEKTLVDATARNANSAPAFNQLGIVYRRLGRFQEADEAYQRALALDENYASAWLNLGVLCDLYLQQPQRALDAYEKYLSLAASPDAKVTGWVTELKARLNSGRSARTE